MARLSSRQNLRHNSDMAKPVLLVIAGCNGSGKSTFSDVLADSKFSPFDYDKYFLDYYNELLDIDIRQEMAHNKAWNELERQVSGAIATSADFCYETNFNSTPLHWPEKFKQAGYELRMIYLCLDSVETARKRVAIRVQNGGHFVPDDEVEKRYYEGFAHINQHYSFFDYIDLFEVSAYNEPPAYLFSVERGEYITKANTHAYLEELIPAIVNLTVQ